ncbi:caspase family protein [Bacillus smithii]|uniref:caspase family protein n=1 Tax=Bacillus smithii TaxID=1479 RepID=UPI002E233E6E|nr:caspase family protein [Bacillus smithii]MED1456904.1 caspase family protein [Bacillus smithii]
MSNTKALVVGVSNYYIAGAGNLPFVKNDVIEMEEALCSGLKLNTDDIITLGKKEDVKKEEFINSILQISGLLNKDDNFIFYFSGHGAKIENQHYLVCSDNFISTQEIIIYFERVSAKGKIIFLDCCYSGNFSVDETPVFSIEETVNDFVGRGYAVFSSSSSTQLSYRHPDKQISIFTSFLCSALKDSHIIRQGKVSLYDIQKLVRLYLEVWNKKNPDKQQHPIFRSNMGGTIYFEVKEYVPFYTTRIYEEYDKYIIYTVEPLHIGLTKRYAVKTILKEPFSLEEIGEISLEITKIIKHAEVYNNEITKERLSGKSANIIWNYFGRDESDIVKNNYICVTTWVDDSQDKKWWYRIDNKDTFFINGVHYKIFPYYELIRTYYKENTGSKNDLILETKKILASVISLAQKVIHFFNEYNNRVLTEEDFLKKMDYLIPEINKYVVESQNLNIPPDEIRDWSQACADLIGTIYDFTLFYNRKYLSQRTLENRKSCMEMAIKQYLLDLEKVRSLEEKL